DHLAFYFPDQVTAGTPFTGTVIAQDAFGNTVSNHSSVVTIAARGPGAFRADSTTSEPASGGVATFPNLVLGTVGSYVITATDGALTGAMSAPVAVLPGQAAQLRISTQPPASIRAGSGFGMVVEARDSSG